MANRFPLIANTSAGQIQELASGDNLDLTGNNITGVGVVTATTFSGNVTGNLTGEVNAAAFDTNSSGVVVTGVATATTFSGNLSGNVTGNLSGNITGAASTAAVLGINTTSLNGTKLYVRGNSASEIVAVSTASTITIDMSTGNNFTITLNGNYTLGNPTNITAGQSGSIFLLQDSTGSRTLGFSTFWDFSSGTAPTLTTTASSVDRLDYIVRTSTSIHTVFSSNYS